MTFFCSFATLFTALIISVENGNSSSDSELEEISAKKFSCGLNAAYLFARLSGTRASYYEMEKRVSKSEMTSLGELRSLLSEFGLDTNVYKLDLTNKNFPTPAIVHFVGASRTENHFIVTCDADESSITYLDATSAEVFEVERRWLIPRLSGFVIIKQPTCDRLVITFVSGSLILCFFLLLLFRARFPNSRPR